MVLLKLAVVLFVIVVGIRATWTRRTGTRSSPSAWPGVFKGAAYIFFAYIGFDSVSTHAEEAKNPQRDVPIGIITSLVLCTVLYIAVAAVLTGMVPYDADRHRRAGRRRVRARTGSTLATFLISLGRGRRHHERAAGDAAQPGPRAARHGARRPDPAQLLRGRAPALPHAAQGDDPDRPRWSAIVRRCSR